MSSLLQEPSADAALLRTKLVPPPHYGALILRERLHRRLDAVSRHKVVLVAAPAGFGKTTVVSSWLGAYDGEHAWVALDDGDNDPVRFWRYVFAALEQFAPSATDAALRRLHDGPRPEIEQAISTWLHAVGVMTTHGVLVLDDYHVIDNAAIHASVEMLLHHLPPTLHVVLVGRSVPPFSLARMRVHGALLHLDAADLRFTPDEIARFVQHVAPDAGSADLVAALDQRTEGWAVGLRVLSLAWSDDPHAWATLLYNQASHRHIHEYIIDDVFGAQPAELQQFILETSGLDRLCVSLCDAVRGRNDSADLLAEIERRNLFIMPLDTARQWFRFHSLFGETIRREAARRSTEHERRERALRVCRWYQAHGMLEDAIEAALDAHAYEDAAALIERVCMAHPPYFENHSARGWLERLPRAVEAAHPTLCLIHAQAILFTTERRNMETRTLVEAPLRLAEERCLQTGDRRQLGAVYSLWALLLMWQGDHQAMAHYAHRAVPLLAHEDFLWRGMSLVLVALDTYNAGNLVAARAYALDARACAARSRNLHNLYAATLVLGNIHAELGALHDATLYYDEIVDGIGPDASGEQLTKRGMALAGLAAIALERDQRDHARRRATEARAVGLALGNDDIVVRAGLVLANVARLDGADADARQLMRDLRTVARRPELLRAVCLTDARDALADGITVAARRWRTTLRPVDERRDALGLRETLVEARLLLAEHDTAAARTLLESVRVHAGAQGRAAILAETLVLLASCHDEDGERAVAISTLTGALDLAHAERYVRVVLHEGERIVPLLKYIGAGSGAAAAFARTLLQAYDADTAQPEPLTPQELRVLDLLAAGHSNQEMAQTFVVSVNTIKTQVKSIYRKLNVTNRLQAANAVRQWSSH